MGNTYTDFYFCSIRTPVIFMGVWFCQNDWRLWDMGYESYTPLVALSLN